MKILIIEDEKLLSESIKVLLTRKGYEVECAYDGATGVEFAELGLYDLLILDVMMPKMNGYEVANVLRKKKCSTPILMLTAKSELEDRITGLNSGADYYLTKPFDTGELLACVNALLRRQGGQVDSMSYGNTSLDLSTCILSNNDKSIRLSDREFDMMRFLLQTKEHNISKEALLIKIWGLESNATENHVEVYVGFLRKKLQSIGSNIQNEALRRQGYHLEVKKND